MCGLEFIPALIESGITSLKIEGRMKSPEYVATVTRIYRKYIDLAYNDSKTYVIDNKDKQDLLQVFNRGGFSSGHLSNEENHNLIFPDRQNNMGIYLGKISKYNSYKGIVSCKLENNVDLGDSISFENENTKYTISELMNRNINIKSANQGDSVSFGRMKGNIKVGDKIYKINSKSLLEKAKLSYLKEYITQVLNCTILITNYAPILVKIYCPNFNKTIEFTYNYIPQPSQNQPLTKDKIINQFNKTSDTPFNFKEFNISLDDNLFLPISVLNELRRIGIEKIETAITDAFKRSHINNNKSQKKCIYDSNKESKISLLLNILNLHYDYNLLKKLIGYTFR